MDNKILYIGGGILAVGVVAAVIISKRNDKKVGFEQGEKKETDEKNVGLNLDFSIPSFMNWKHKQGGAATKPFIPQNLKGVGGTYQPIVPVNINVPSIYGNASGDDIIGR